MGELVAAWESSGLGDTTIRNRLGSLQAMLNWAARPRDDRPIERLIAANPVAGFEMPRATYPGERYAPKEEVEAFLGWLDDRAAKATGKLARFERVLAVLVRLAADAGCRPGELCVLRWEYYDEARRAFILPPKKHKTGRKTGRRRVILASAATAARLAALRAEPGAHPEWVFTHACAAHVARTPEQRAVGDPWNSNALSRRIKELRREAIAAGVLSEDAGLGRMHLYRLRHTKITDLLQDGANIVDVAALSGNSIKVIESTYLHHSLDRLREVADRPGGDKP